MNTKPKLYYRVLEQLDKLAGDSWVDINAEAIEQSFMKHFEADTMHFGNYVTYAEAILEDVQ